MSIPSSKALICYRLLTIASSMTSSSSVNMPITTETTTTQYLMQSLCTSLTPGASTKLSEEEVTLREGGKKRVTVKLGQELTDLSGPSLGRSV